MIEEELLPTRHRRLPSLSNAVLKLEGYIQRVVLTFTFGRVSDVSIFAPTTSTFCWQLTSGTFGGLMWLWGLVWNRPVRALSRIFEVFISKTFPKEKKSK